MAENETVAQRVLAETYRFNAALPGLLERYPGKWVVFRDGEVVSVFDDEQAAYGDALARFGAEGGFVVAPVVPTAPTPITASVLFGLA